MSTTRNAPPAPEHGAAPRAQLPWWIAVALLAIALRLLSAGDAWSPDNRDFHGLFGAFATGGPATDLAQRGLFESGGMPYQWRVDLADGSHATRWYMHHPPAYMLISAAFIEWLGPYEDALRIPPLLFSLFSIFAAYRFGREFASERSARFAALLMAVIPYSARDGMQTWTEAAIAGTTCFVLIHGVRWMDHRRVRDLVLTGVWLAAGALLDWPAHFVLPGLAIYALVRCSAEGNWSRFFWAWTLPLLSGLLLGAHKLHMVLVAGKEGAMQDSGNTLAYVMGWGPYANLTYARTQLGFQQLGFTGPVLLLASLGACGLLVRRSSVSAVVIWVLLAPLAWFLLDVSVLWIGVLWPIGLVVLNGERPVGRGAALLLGLLPGLWYVLLFPGRSNNHDFFMLVSAPAVCVAAALGALALADRVSELAPRRGISARSGSFVLGAIAVGIALLSTLVVLLQWMRFRSDELPLLARQEWIAPILEDDSAVVITHMSRGACLPFYSRAPIVYGTDSVEALDGFLHGIVDRIEPERRAVFLFDQFWGLQDPKMQPVLSKLMTIGAATEHVVDIGKGPQSFWLVELPTGAGLDG
jgi:4-amino-4-deoxy-L-arabinose transferase-like glycosyltransferase